MKNTAFRSSRCAPRRRSSQKWNHGGVGPLPSLFLIPALPRERGMVLMAGSSPERVSRGPNGRRGPGATVPISGGPLRRINGGF